MKIVIFGSGLIGRCWALLFSRAGHTVVLYDIMDSQLATALQSVLEQLQSLEAAGLLSGQKAEDVHKRVHSSTDLKSAITDADYLQECIPETIDFKLKAFQQLDDLVEQVGNKKIILASSTSCITASSFTEKLVNRARCIVAHPVNPPHFIPVVEVVPAPWTDPAVIAGTRKILSDIGQAPVVLNKEVDGFLINRLQYAMLMEAYRLVEDGVCSPEDVDTAVSQGLGLRWSFMGPFETIDLNAPQGVPDYCQRYADGILRVCNTMGPPRPMQGNAVDAINDAMRNRYTDLDARRKWRDGRLAALAIHKLQQSEKEKEKTK